MPGRRDRNELVQRFLIAWLVSANVGVATWIICALILNRSIYSAVSVAGVALIFSGFALSAIATATTPIITTPSVIVDRTTDDASTPKAGRLVVGEIAAAVAATHTRDRVLRRLAELQTTLAHRERVPRPDHSDTPSSPDNLAPESAEPLDRARLVATLADCERLLGPDHPVTAAVRAELGVVQGAPTVKPSALPNRSASTDPAEQ